MRLLIATSNPGKLREIVEVFALASDEQLELVTLADLPSITAPEETGATFWENAREKALAYARGSGLTAAAEDSGIEIEALGGEPGVTSARFLGPATPYPERFAEIYRRLQHDCGAVKSDARFVTALSVAQPDGTVVFETEAGIDGEIAPRSAGANGFGYDPIFFYAPFRRTTAELSMREKCAVSHRARAFRDFVRWHRSQRI